MFRGDLKKQIADNVMQNKECYYRLAYSYVKNSEDALDIVQESILKAMKAADQLEKPEYINTWLYRIVVNTSLGFLKKQKKVVLMDEDILAAYDSGTEDSYENIDLRKAMDILPENCRSIIVLRYFEDLKLEEVAEILNENVNTIKTRLYKSLGKLKIAMNEQVGRV